MVSPVYIWLIFFFSGKGAKMDSEIQEMKKMEIKESSSFILDEALEGREKIREKLNQLEQDIEESIDTNQEIIWIHNFISYLYWKLGDRQKAFEAIERAKTLDEPSLITFCNEILFNIESAEYSQSEKLMEKLENHTFKQKRVRTQADAEIAYCYSRLGPKHHDKAVRGFRQAIKDISPERNIFWEYRLALTLRRQCHLHQMLKPDILVINPVDNRKEAACLLYKVLVFDSKKNCQIKARAWCELGKIIFKDKNLYEIIEIDKTETLKIDGRKCFEEAFKLCPDDYHVLHSYGSHLRYNNRVEESKSCLQKAIRLRDNPSSRHHLALTLKRLVQIENSTPKYTRNLQEGDHSTRNRRCSSRVITMPEQSATMSVVGLGVNQFTLRSNQDSQFRSPEDTFKHQQSHSDVKNLCEGNTQKDCRALANELCDLSKCHSKTRKLPPILKKGLVSKSQKNFIARKKSPVSICVSRDNPLLLEAIDHLEKAIEMCAGFDVARYEKGLIYRMLDKPDEALNCFSYITSNNCGKPSEYPIMLVNAYEQQAICKLGLIAQESDKEKKVALKYDAQRCMWNAITVISGVIGALPMLRTANQCFPTLKKMLQDEEQSSETLKKLAQLHEKMENNEEAIECYKKIIELLDDDDPNILEKLVKNYLKVDDFDNAICTLSVLQYTDKLKEFDKSFYVSTYIKGAKISLEKKDFDMAKIRFLKVYETIIFESNKLGQDKKDDESFPDVLILDDCNEEGVCQWVKPIKSALESFIKLQVVVNHMDCLPGKSTIEYLNKTMLKARYIILILHECNDAKKDEFIKMALIELRLKHLAKTLFIRVDGFSIDFPGSKEVILSLDDSNVENMTLWQGNLLYNMLLKW